MYRSETDICSHNRATFSIAAKEEQDEDDGGSEADKT